MITVFTPTYNRAYSLPTLYQSLLDQSRKDFEWVVVDDGSTDNTKQLFELWQQENKIAITYVYQPNAGKMQAVNKGVSLAKGEYFWIVDSDDYLTKDGVELTRYYIDSLPKTEKFAGVAGLKVHKDNKVMGSASQGEYTDCLSFNRSRHKIAGDKAEVILTALLKQFPFPQFSGEKFVPESLIWNRVAGAGYKFRWFNRAVCVCEYLPDGYTQNADKNLIANWQGYSLYVKEFLALPAPVKDKILIGGAYGVRFIKKMLGRG